MDFRLVNLDCPTCGSAMQASGTDSLFFCRHCGGGAQLGETEIERLSSAALMPAPGSRAEVWLPAWEVETEVRVASRRRFGGQETPGWSGVETSIIPAFELPLEDLIPLARALSSAAHTIRDVPDEPCRGGTLNLDDALVFIRYLVLLREVEQPDQLAGVELEVDSRSARLLAIPFERAQPRLRCAVTGTVIRQR